MNKDKNLYTILYAAVMVIFVAVVLAFVSQSLGDRQRNNEKIDKMQQILRSVNAGTDNKEEVISKYTSVIKQELLIKQDGSVEKTFEGEDLAKNEAFDMNTRNAFKLLPSNPNMSLPLYIAEVDGQTKYIIPMNGAGLWGPIWGYIALDDDCSKVFGTDFSHEGETPGLGAEITRKEFSQQFVGKEIFKGGEFKSIAVVKKGHKAEGMDYVDGISGGTLTSNGVNDMLNSSLRPYRQYLMNNAKN